MSSSWTWWPSTAWISGDWSANICSSRWSNVTTGTCNWRTKSKLAKLDGRPRRTKCCVRPSWATRSRWSSGRKSLIRCQVAWQGSAVSAGCTKLTQISSKISGRRRRTSSSSNYTNNSAASGRRCPTLSKDATITKSKTASTKTSRRE